MDSKDLFKKVDLNKLRENFKQVYNAKLASIQIYIKMHSKNDILRGYEEEISELPFILKNDDFNNIEWYIPEVRLKSLRSRLWLATFRFDVIEAFGKDFIQDLGIIIHEIEHFRLNNHE